MKIITRIAIFITWIIAIPLLIWNFVASADVLKYATCKEMNKVYKNGVGLPDAKNMVNKKPKASKHFVDIALYNANIKSDRDKDGIACEK